MPRLTLSLPEELGRSAEAREDVTAAASTLSPAGREPRGPVAASESGGPGDDAEREGQERPLIVRWVDCWAGKT